MESIKVGVLAFSVAVSEISLKFVIFNEVLPLAEVHFLY